MIRNNHTALINDTLVELGMRRDLGFFYKQNTGKAWDFETKSRLISYGFKGAGDITGLLPWGQRIECEGKTGRGRQSVPQKTFQKVIESYGGIYVIFRTPQELIKNLEALKLAHRG